jgi:hypothetical protein
MAVAKSRGLIFWGSAALFAAAFAALVPFVFPFGALRLVTPEDRERVWLLTVFCAGVMALLFGLSGLMGTLGYIGVRDVNEAGSVIEAMKQRARARKADSPSTRNFGVWIVAAGVFLIAAYFVLLVALR